MEQLDYWRLCDELSVIQAALLIVGEDPAGKQEWVERTDPDNRPRGFDAAFAALKNAINAGRLLATIRHQSRLRGWNEDPEEGESIGTDVRGRQIIYIDEPDWGLSTIHVEDLQKFLASRGIKTGFFFPQGTAAPDYLDPKHPNYAPKLAAAIDAWQAVTSQPELMRGTTAKQAMMRWLRQYAVIYGLTKDDGSPNEQGIEEVAKIANWVPQGGPPKTPGG